jgi:hypothetical protein
MHTAAGYSKTGLVRKRSYTSKMLSVASDTVTGATVGFQCGGWVGAIVGAEIGTHVGIAKMMIEEGRTDQFINMFLLPSPFAGLYL